LLNPQLFGVFLFSVSNSVLLTNNTVEGEQLGDIATGDKD
jgi:hypothetical protein